MNLKLPVALLLIAMLAIAQQGMAQSQACTVIGQNPATSFPVCGSNVFSQNSVPQCSNGNVPSPTCTTFPYAALNPYWYKFTCFTAGTLGFLISPNNAGDDYDWELFDVTGRALSDVFTDASLVVASNWSGVPGNTGTSATATSLFECASTTIPPTGPPPFSRMPSLIKGHNYLLMISHFSGSDQSGYQLSFGGGTSSITDMTPPLIESATAICDGSHIQIALNKPMQCASLDADGSDFTLIRTTGGPLPPGLKIVGAYSTNCTGFDLDTLTVVLNGPLPLGNYSIAARNGTDGNTLLDICGAAIPVGQSGSFTMVAPQPTPLDKIVQPGCDPSLLELRFPKKMHCSSIAPDGSDFTIQGPSAVTVAGAYGRCDTGNMTTSVFVKLAAPIKIGGVYRIFLGTGTDGNTLIDDCDLQSPAGSLPFTTSDSVSAALMTDQILSGCRTDTIVYQYPAVNGVNEWHWLFDGRDSSRLQDPPPRYYTVFGKKTARLIVSNGTCTDTASLSPVLPDPVRAGLEVPDIICPKDAANYLNKSTGPVSAWNWDLGDGATFAGENPPDHLYPQTGIETKYTVTLIVSNAAGCYDTARQPIDVLRSCYIAVPGAFTPNGDGLNDYLYPLNAYKADNLSFKVFNRFGMIVFESHEWTRKWDGTFDGHPQPAGTYVWMLDYTDRDTRKHIFQKGTSILIR